MITHHPKKELLQAFVAGELPASLSIGVAAHIEMCDECAKVVAALTAKSAAEIFDTTEKEIVFEDDMLLTMMNDITEDDTQDKISTVTAPSITMDNKTISLPRVFNQVPLKNWNKLGDVSRSRLDLNEEPLRSSLLNIAPQGEVPMHSHKGFELTLILDGSFTDDMGYYQAGDFIWLDGQHTHSPVTSNGCLCYTVSDDALQFTKGLSKLLNPIGSFIY